MSPEIQNVIVFRELLLPGSETFILNQTQALQRFSPFYVGSRRCNGLRTPDASTFAVNSGHLGTLREARLRVLGQLGSSEQRIRSLNPALVHAHFGTDAVTALRLGRRLGVPTLATYHGGDVTMADDHARRGSYSRRRYIRRRSDLQSGLVLHIAASAFIRRKLLEQGFPESRTIVHYIGVDTAKFSVPDTVNRRPLVLFVGRLVENKGCTHLIEAASAVQKTVPGTEVVIIGDGPLRAELERQAASLERVRFLGMRPPSEVADWLREARVLCVPSVTIATGESEGFGLVFAESQASGVPVVSFSTGGIPEAVEHGVSGLLCAERDNDALARNLARLLSDDALLRRMSCAGVVRVRREFDLARQTAKLEQIYDDILRATGSAWESKGRDAA